MSKLFSALLRIFAAVLFTFAAFLLASVAITLIRPEPGHPWAFGFINHISMLVFTLVMALILSKGKLSEYGFKLPVNFQPIKMMIFGLGIGIGGATLSALIIQPLTPMSDSMMSTGFLHILLFVWLIASICEEVLYRGLIQSFLSPLSKYGFTIIRFRISIPVLIGAFLFGVMHMMLLTMGMDFAFVLSIVILAFIMGVVAGYYREKTGSLISAIIVHIFANIGGYLLSKL